MRFIFDVTDPCNVSTREIKVSREITEEKTLTCSVRAPLEMTLSKPLKPQLQRVKKSLMDEAAGKTHDDQTKADEVNKTNVVTVESKVYRIDMVAKGAESQNRRSFWSQDR